MYMYMYIPYMCHQVHRPEERKVGPSQNGLYSAPGSSVLDTCFKGRVDPRLRDNRRRVGEGVGSPMCLPLYLCQFC